MRAVRCWGGAGGSHDFFLAKTQPRAQVVSECPEKSQLFCPLCSWFCVGGKRMTRNRSPSALAERSIVFKGAPGWLQLVEHTT